MSIVRAAKIGGIFFVLAVLGLAGSVFQVMWDISILKDVSRQQFESALLAQEVRAVSTALTNNARSYVSSALPQYEKVYWDIVKIRAGELARPSDAYISPGQVTATSTLLREAGFTQEELGLLEESQRLSAKLVLLEEEAMNAVKGLFKDSAGTYTRQGEPDMELARSLMFSREYDAGVAQIMAPSHKFDQLVKERVAVLSGDAESAINRAMVMLGISVAVICFIFACSMIIFMRRIVKPVSAGAEYAKSIASGHLDAVPPTVSFSVKNEIAQLIVSMQDMVAALKDRIQDAERQTRNAQEHEQMAEASLQEAFQAKAVSEKNRDAILDAASNIENVVARFTRSLETLASEIQRSTRGAEMQRDRVASSATAMEEMNATVLEVAKNAHSAASESENVRKKATDGEAVMMKSVGSMNGVQRETEDLRQAMENLGQRAEAIGTIMTVISDIADQTNLLALNAAIEAARAGEAGRGFAVVADEVRKLAEKTVEATKQVGEVISGIQTGTQQSIGMVERTTGHLHDSTELVQQSGHALMDIVSGISEVSTQISSIATAAEEQSAASDEITHSLDEINKRAEDNAEIMHNALQAVELLSDEAKGLLLLVRKLRNEG